jgi:hypothetical protein
MDFLNETKHHKISKQACSLIILWRIYPLLGNNSVNTSRGNEYATIEDIRC